MLCKIIWQLFYQYHLRELNIRKHFVARSRGSLLGETTWGLNRNISTRKFPANLSALIATMYFWNLLLWVAITCCVQSATKKEWNGKRLSVLYARKHCARATRRLIQSGRNITRTWKLIVLKAAKEYCHLETLMIILLITASWLLRFASTLVALERYDEKI